jgi:hypothetical protein
MLPADSARIEVRNHILNPAEAEIWMMVQPIHPLAGGELRGRLVGPRCPYATTVEVAYPVRPLPGQLAKAGDLTARVLIPEPSFWDPEAPFLYQGSVELWKDGKRCFEAEISHGLRVLQLDKGGLRCNSRGLTIRGVPRRQLAAEDALQLRREGYNTLLSPVSAETAQVWDAADRFGFLVLGRLPDMDTAFRQAESLKFHASCLGWLLPGDALADGALPATELARLQSGNGQLLGVELDRHPPSWLLQGIQFIFARDDLLPLEGEVRRPVLLKSPKRSGAAEGKNQASASPEILGLIVE